MGDKFVASSGKGESKVDIDIDLMSLRKLRDSHENLFARAFVVVPKVLLGVTADQNVKIDLLSGLFHSWTSRLKVSVAHFGCQLEDLGTCRGVDACVIGEAP